MHDEIHTHASAQPPTRYECVWTLLRLCVNAHIHLLDRTHVSSHIYVDTPSQMCTWLHVYTLTGFDRPAAVAFHPSCAGWELTGSLR